MYLPSTIVSPPEVGGREGQRRGGRKEGKEPQEGGREGGKGKVRKGGTKVHVSEQLKYEEVISYQLELGK